jgi:hypothetical protein
VKLTARLLLTLPFVLVSFLYLRLQLSDNGCWGLIELVYTVTLWIFLALTFIISAIATLRKSQSQNLKAEPYALTITLITLLALIIGGLGGNSLKGAKWIQAKSQNYNAQPSAQDLTLRENGTFTVYLREDDFTCYYTGNYNKTYDTITFDKETIDKIGSKMTLQYLIRDKVLIPLTNQFNDKDEYLKFDITSTK